MAVLNLKNVAGKTLARKCASDLQPGDVVLVNGQRKTVARPVAPVNGANRVVEVKFNFDTPRRFESRHAFAVVR
jgi:cell wall-associated NlpC family hydrolase